MNVLYGLLFFPVVLVSFLSHVVIVVVVDVDVKFRFYCIEQQRQPRKMTHKIGDNFSSRNIKSRSFSDCNFFL